MQLYTCKFHSERNAIIKCKDCGCRICIDCAIRFKGGKGFKQNKLVCPPCNVRNVEWEHNSFLGCCGMGLVVVFSIFIISNGGKSSPKVIALCGLFAILALIKICNAIFLNGQEEVNFAKRKAYSTLRQQKKRLNMEKRAKIQKKPVPEIQSNRGSMKVPLNKILFECQYCANIMREQDSFCGECGSRII